MLSTKSFFFLHFCFVLVCHTKGIMASNPQSQVPDSLSTMSAEQLIERIQSTDSKESKIYETTLQHISENDLILSRQQYRIACYFYNQEQYERSLYYLQKAITIAKTIKNDRLLCTYYLKSGNAYLKDWKNQQSLDSYYQALNIAEKKESIDHIIIANSGIAIIQRRMGQLDKALEVCKNSLNLIDKSSYRRKINHVNLLTILSETYLDQKKYDSVIKYANIGIDISTSLDYPIGTIDLFTKKGIAFFEQNQLNKGFQYLKKAEEVLIEKNVKQKKSIFNLNYFLAYYYFKKENYNTAISYLENTASIIEEKDLRNIRILEIYRLLADSYLALDKRKKSIHWLQKLVKLQDQFQDEKNKTVLKLHNKDTEKLNEQIKVLEEQNKKGEHYNNLTLYLLLLVCLALILITFQYHRKQKNNTKRFNQLLKKTNSSEIKEKNAVTPVIIDDKKVNDVLTGLHKLEQQEFFLNTDCDLRSMAKKVKTNTTYLSKIIKTQKADSFNDYINDLRISYVLKRLKNDKKFRSFSIKSIALEIGYKTDNSFTKHFKSKTGLNPSYYIKKLNSNDNNS